ncbi:MAG: metalloregulator ArsR/SmtB family transcription factor [Tenuifilum sp.]|jgi:predicted transcriptional regulator|uniref:ArsR/SmtB family transcription factor n=1 Tax=Tenuifilum sp. TaxID=2760880 RepID=UPI001B4214D1|nr:winged helix-turn-helix transcriptional regulator [Bacteroidales bacterium]HOK60034.1 metalloregulator ArsR/SmtB family transcription factor [Tenuifilum sp.]MBP9028410.1 winged helix-turn-helix transcriptional regulator [Bacteroidales bacterium]HOK84744.1 metalloregulator ArsR/SmtB family transcription factor [Tenuifilum sp.]HON69736.1 metalloregulator ArsR/SmtB family transcription factor [Tenuifilum sp.]
MKSNYTEEQVKLARYAKALSHPVRVQILQILSQQSCCYSGDIVNDLPIARSTLSQHLTELREAGLIQGEFNPPKIKYCIRPEAWNEAREIFDRFFNSNIWEAVNTNSCSTNAGKSK